MDKADNIKKRLYGIVRKLRNRISDDSLLISAGEYPNDVYFKEKKKEFKKIFRNREARNIAVWGYAGVGKSSFIRHFEAKTLHIPLSSFLKVSITRSSDNMKKYSKKEIEKRLASQINYQYHRKILFTAIDFFILAVSILFFLNSNWIKTNFSISDEVYKRFSIPFSIAGSITFFRLLMMMLNWFSISKCLIKIGKANGNNGIEMDLSLKSPEIKESLIRMKWKIRSTVVFEDLELFGSEIFIPVVQDLFQLNTEVNSEIEKSFVWKLFRRPIRFIYVCRDGDIRRKIGDKQFQDYIFIENRLTCNNLHFYIEDIVNKQISSDLCRRMTKGDEKVTYDFDFFNSIARIIGPEDLNFRKVNQILKRYISLWNDFSRDLGRLKTSNDDYTRLMGFVIYGEYYPEDLQKFKTGSCLAIQNISKNKLKNKVDKPDLFVFLTQECSERYRVNYSCIKYLGVSVEEIKRLEKEIAQKMKAGEYEKALILIDILDIYYPDKCEYQKLKEDVREKLGDPVMKRKELYGN